MTFGMIPNPKKSVVVDFTLDEIKSVLIKLPKYFGNKYTLDAQNDLMSQYTFGALEFLSLGVSIDINLNYVTENKTNIEVEVRRKIGAFDKSFEVQKANQHIQNIFNGISTLLTNVRKAAAAVEASNPVLIINYDLTWKDVRRHIDTFLSVYHTVYKLASEDALREDIVLRRFPQKGDDVALNIDAIIKITKIESTENSSQAKFEITNDNNKITTQGELQRNTLILKITINLIQKIINELKAYITKAEAELESVRKWKVGRSDSAKAEQIHKAEKILEEFKLRLKSNN